MVTLQSHPMPTSNTDLHALAVEVATLNQRFSGVESDIRDLKVGVQNLMAIREDLVRFNVQHDQQQGEMETMWKKVDGLRGDIEGVRNQDLANVKKELHQWQGASTLARYIFTAICGGLMAAVGHLYFVLGDVRVLQQQVKHLEQVVEPRTK